MNDEQAAVQKSRVKAMYDRWGPPLGLGWQRKVSFEWYRGAIPDHEQAAMTCDPSWEYKEAQLGVNLCKVADLDDEDLEWAVVHEVMHVFLGGLLVAHMKHVDGDAFRLIEEHTASSLAQAVMWLSADRGTSCTSLVSEGGHADDHDIKAEGGGSGGAATGGSPTRGRGSDDPHGRSADAPVVGRPAAGDLAGRRPSGDGADDTWAGEREDAGIEHGRDVVIDGVRYAAGCEGCQRALAELQRELA